MCTWVKQSPEKPTVLVWFGKHWGLVLSEFTLDVEWSDLQLGELPEGEPYPVLCECSWTSRSAARR